MNKPVKTQLAELLHNLGFNEPCEAYYTKHGVSIPELIFCQRGEEKECALIRRKPILYLAPSIADVIDWLYKTHKIWIDIIKYKDHGDDVNDPYYFTYDYGRHIYKTPIEAYEAAIIEVLNKLN